MLDFCHVLRYFLFPFLFRYLYRDAPELEKKTGNGALIKRQIDWFHINKEH